MAGVIRSDDVDFERYMEESEPRMRVKPAASWVDEVIEQMAAAEHGDPNPCLPWAKTAGDFRLRPGEVTLWAGASQSGKSLLTGQVSQSLGAQGERCMIASFEMKPVMTIDRMLRQTFPLARGGPGPQHARRWGLWSNNRLWLYDQRGSVKSRNLAAAIRYCAEELGITQVFVDNMAKCLAMETDYDEQKAFVSLLTGLAVDHGIHIHLVHHVKKGEKEDEVPEKWSVKGSSAITDLVDNVLLVWANKRKRRDMEEGKTERADEPDAMIICDKQRNGPFNGRWRLWQVPGSLQFVESALLQPVDLMAWPHIPMTAF